MVIMPVREHNEGYFPAGLGGDDVEVPFIIRSWIDHDGGTIFIAFNNPRICTFKRCVAGVVTQHYTRSEEHTSELQSRFDLVCRLLLEKKNMRIRRQA